MKKLLLPLVIVIILALVAGVGGIFWFTQVNQPFSSDSTQKRFVITRGASTSQVANKLESEGFIKSALAFRFYVQTNNLTKSIPAGEFSLSPNLTIPQIIKKLLAGPTQVWVTVPEGLRREQIPARFVEGLELTGERATAFEQEFLAQTTQLEGYLYPETYLFPKEATAGAVIKRMTQTLQSKNGGEMPSKDIVTLASILERETKDIKTEGPIVAGILLKRMNAGWPLQADATVQYVLGTPAEWWPTPLRADLQISSPYNTYKIIGLPPTPIASPGIEAIKAAQAPEASDYWYYIHDLEGKIHFAVTLEEHNQNVAKYLR